MAANRHQSMRDHPAVAALRDWFEGLGALEQDLVQRHLCARNPLTLTHLAHNHAIPVAIVRQTRNQLHLRLDETLLQDTAALGSVTAVDDELLVPTEWEELVARHAWLGASLSDRYDITTLNILLGLRWCDAQNGPWLFENDIRSCVAGTLKVLDLEPLQVMTLEAARRCLTAANTPVPLHEPQLQRWLTYCGLETWRTPQGWTVRASAPEANLVEDDGSRSEIDDEALYYSPSLPKALSRLASLMHAEHEGAGPVTLGQILKTADNAEGELGLLSRSIRDAVAAVPGAWTLGTGRRYTAAVEHVHTATDPEGTDDAAESDDEPTDSNAERAEWLQSLQDDSRAVLLTTGVSLTAGEIVERLDRRVRLRTLRDVLTKDEQVISLGRDSWTLAPLPPDQPTSKPKTRSQLDAPAEVLAHEGFPLSTAELRERSGLRIQPTYLKQKLDTDPRFHRSAKDLWALSEWGLPVYKPMKELVSDLVDRHGGAIGADDVVRQLVRDFGVKEPSLRQVMSSPPFTVRKGLVRRLADIQEEQAGSPAPSGHSSSDRPGAPTVDDLIEDMGLI
ncbi:hypothetical protein [Streptomyces sp. CBMA156]|uniref:hypothetical protein n=1 Tax=Streptomyces sp. CBMA156 TaxID=1930280 RepID=UPI001661A2D8|nr:hypothetical protein [Streptomyces sp. CBMA156]MBD0676983.1 hypothetical protein [Streptomyces sp. CBMA156]